MIFSVKAVTTHPLKLIHFNEYILRSMKYNPLSLVNRITLKYHNITIYDLNLSCEIKANL